MTMAMNMIVTTRVRVMKAMMNTIMTMDASDDELKEDGNDDVPCEQRFPSCMAFF